MENPVTPVTPATTTEPLPAPVSVTSTEPAAVSATPVEPAPVTPTVEPVQPIPATPAPIEAAPVLPAVAPEQPTPVAPLPTPAPVTPLAAEPVTPTLSPLTSTTADYTPLPQKAAQSKKTLFLVLALLILVGAIAIAAFLLFSNKAQPADTVTPTPTPTPVVNPPASQPISSANQTSELTSIPADESEKAKAALMQKDWSNFSGPQLWNSGTIAANICNNNDFTFGDYTSVTEVDSSEVNTADFSSYVVSGNLSGLTDLKFFNVLANASCTPDITGSAFRELPFNAFVIMSKDSADNWTVAGTLNFYMKTN